ncbi:Fic family protein [Zarconia navalis]|nr:Fic family protein [Zarconia navalis]
MYPSDCPEWEYIDFPNREIILKRKTIDLLVQLRRQELDSAASAIDSRPVHRYLFCDLTPTECEYFAGNYRGSDFHCLRHYPIYVKGDARVGARPEIVGERMKQLSQTIQFGLEVLDTTYPRSDTQHGKVKHLLDTIAIACQVFEETLRIHPYANGNGHAARFVVWAILGRYGYWPKRFPISPRPEDLAYVESLVKYRNGNPLPLQEYILECIIG